MRHTTSLREAVIAKAHQASDATLMSMLTATSGQEDEDAMLKLDEAGLEEIRRRRARHKNGEGQTYTIAEVKESLREQFGDGMV